MGFRAGNAKMDVCLILFSVIIEAFTVDFLIKVTSLLENGFVIVDYDLGVCV